MAKSKIKMPTETITDKNIKLVMSVLRRPKTINYLSKLIGGTYMDARKIIARIRKHHPVYAYRDGKGYKYASKKEAVALIKFERKLIKNHQKNLQVLLDYVGN